MRASKEEFLRIPSIDPWTRRRPGPTNISPTSIGRRRVRAYDGRSSTAVYFRLPEENRLLYDAAGETGPVPASEVRDRISRKTAKPLIQR